MSWLLNLYQTYENNEDQVGKWAKKGEDREYTLLPISHTTQNAHIEVTVDDSGHLLRAKAMKKVSTLIPCTEESASRAGSKVTPYPLHDKISYVAGDFQKYGGVIKNQDDIPYNAYMKNLKAWAESTFATNKVKAIYAYLAKGTLIEDLVNENVLVLKDGKLIEKWDKSLEKIFGEKPEIFSSGTTDQTSAFVRFNVYSPASKTAVWQDKDMYHSFISFYNERLGAEDICFVTGETAPSTERHANKIRHAADKAKLISANDTSGFTFRGRFKKSGEAVGISYDVSQKAHNALKWLIIKQGKAIDDRVFLVWENNGQALPEPGVDAYSLLFPDNDDDEDDEADTGEGFAHEVSKAIAGYRHDFDYKVDVNFLTLDSATTGRMAVLYYRNMNKEQYLNRLEEWHNSCAWEHRYRKRDGKNVAFEGAPSTKDIAWAAYGPRASDKVIKGRMERLLPRIIDERSIQRDIVKSAVNRASNPVAMEKWEWEKTLSITCALVRKMYIDQKEVWDVALNEETTDRSYLFGRLLAVADVLERSALGKDEKRATNAIRYMNSFSKNPARTWRTLQDSLQPYQAKLGTKVTRYSKLIDEIGDAMEFGDFDNKPLKEIYLLGFYSQRRELYKKKTEEETEV
ncbi:LOW QUALITY PROTEIN: CRISPR-associated protein, CT1133 family [Bacillus sp. JCM 19046]|nr:LOW QUALITY PROTEIN: CRISPR-associated protein, CT1133 family [Bacillus sp. JCM 19045]GAF19478.1 LOW QUALITY PROTEIN: CRISPR-associated protein, CT1133 family [Bacillus sp. JCM 19046]